KSRGGNASAAVRKQQTFKPATGHYPASRAFQKGGRRTRVSDHRRRFPARVAREPPRAGTSFHAGSVITRSGQRSRRRSRRFVGCSSRFVPPARAGYGRHPVRARLRTMVGAAGQRRAGGIWEGGFGGSKTDWRGRRGGVYGI